MMPNMIGTRQATRAEAVGTKNASSAITMMVPMRRRLRLVPISEITAKARRRSSPVIDIAAAITSEAAISATAGLVKPSIAADSARDVPSAVLGMRGIGRDAEQEGDQRQEKMELAA